MESRLRQAVVKVCRNPRAGKPLNDELHGWYKLAWESGPVPNWDPWPDMRLVYRFRDGVVKVFAVGKRCPGDPDDVYSLVRERLLSSE